MFGQNTAREYSFLLAFVLNHEVVDVVDEVVALEEVEFCLAGEELVFGFGQRVQEHYWLLLAVDYVVGETFVDEDYDWEGC